MTYFLLLLPLLASAVGELPPEPPQHLTPPQLSIHAKEESVVRRPRNVSTASDDLKPSASEHSLEPHQQEARAILWAAPAIPILSSSRGRSSDHCNPCDRVPWVPMARALNTQQYALSIPTIQLTLPVNYGIPLAQLRPPPQSNQPSQQYGPPQDTAPLAQHYDQPAQQSGPPTYQYGSPPPQSGPPPQQYGPPKNSGPLNQQYGPPPHQLGSLNQQHGALPQQSGPPPQQYGPPPQQSGPPPQQYGPPSQQSGKPPQQYGPPPQQLGPSSHEYAPQHNTSPPPVPSSQYGPHSVTNDGKNNAPPQNQYGPPEDEKPGLPPPPLPQRFLTPSNSYGSPQPQTQYASPSNIKASPIKFLPPPGPNYQFLPALKYGPPFNAKFPPNFNPGKSPSNYPPANPPPPHGSRPVNHGPQQYQDESVRKPVFLQNPIPFPTMSKTQLPPLFNYQIFNDGKRDQLHAYLQPPQPQNVVFTITETDDSCKKCQEQTKVTDSEPAQAEHVTENVVKTTDKLKDSILEQQNPSVQVVKSVPLAEYLQSVEYPMQIIQAPILDVPDLTKYFDLGYHNFAQVTNSNKHLDGRKPEDQKPAQTYSLPSQHNALFVNHNLQNANISFYKHTTAAALDNVDISEDHTQTTNTLPHNHKLNMDSLGKNRETTEKGFTSSPFSQTTAFHTTLTTRPSQIFHISKIKPSTYAEPPRQTQTTAHLPSSPGISTTSGHFVTTKPVTDLNKELQPPNIANPAPFHEPVHSSTQDYKSTVTGVGSSPPVPGNLRFHDHPLGPGGDWGLHPYGRGWGNTPPQPFVMPTATPYRARFADRPSPVTSKKSKHIHQIIVPYTTNKQTLHEVQGPTNSIGWTPIPPTNQGRKVPTNVNFGDQFPSTTGLDQVQQYQNIFPTGNSYINSNIPLSASGSDNLASQQIPTSNVQSLNLPPEVINQILHLKQPGTSWPSGPEGLQQLLVTNLQGLLRGEEDSIDFARLQKNIDNWTAEGYKQNSPSVNFIPVTTIPHIFNSKKIPDEYLTSTEPTVPSNSSNQQTFANHQPGSDSDHEGAESQKHQVKVHPQAHSKDQVDSEDSTESIESLLNGWSLLETKVTTSTEAAEPDVAPSSAPTSKAWEKIQVSISPLTKEKVYVVTPVPVKEAEENSPELLSTRVERSYSVVTAGREAKVPQ